MQAVWKGHNVRQRAELQGRREAAADLQATRQAAAVQIQVSSHPSRYVEFQLEFVVHVSAATYQ